jgi:copper chaperone CopZ
MSNDALSNAQPGRVTLAVTGMTCGGCANAVRRALTRVPGVAGAEVDLAQGRATVEGSAPADALVAAVAAAGYGVRVA